MFSRTRAIRLVLLTWLIAAAPDCADAQMLSEHEVKAAFVVNFAKFTEWPSGSFPYPETPIIIGVAGGLRFEIRLDSTEHVGLEVSSGVLTLAKAVHGKK